MLAPEPESIVVACLRQGLGVEDMRVRHGISEDLSRSIINWLRETGRISEIYGEAATV